MSSELWSGPTTFPCEIPAAGLTVTQLSFDYALTISLEENTQLRIESPFFFSGVNETPVSLSTETDINAAAQTLQVLHSTVVAALLQESGHLKIDFDSGHLLLIEPDESFEAWSYSGSHGELLIALPGGGLAFFNGQQR